MCRRRSGLGALTSSRRQQAVPTPAARSGLRPPARPRPAPALPARGAEGGRAGPGGAGFARLGSVRRRRPRPGMWRRPAGLLLVFAAATAALWLLSVRLSAGQTRRWVCGCGRPALPACPSSPAAARAFLPSQGAAVPGGPGGAAGSGRGAAGLRATAPGRGAGPILRRVPVQAEFRHSRLQPPGTGRGRGARGAGPGLTDRAGGAGRTRPGPQLSRVTLSSSTGRG